MHKTIEQNECNDLNRYPLKISSDLILESKKGELYSQIEIELEGAKLYAKNSHGDIVFLNGVYAENGAEQFSFVDIDGKYLLEVGLSGCNMYFEENGDQYYPKTLDKKILDIIKTSLERILSPVLPEEQKKLK